MSRDTQVIVFASQKGGSGKTTLSGHIAVEAERSGAGPVALIDTDPQGSLAKWWNSRESETPAFAEVSVPDLKRDIEALGNGGFKLIVIDTPPALTSSIAEIITHADLVVIPTRPSPHDLRAVGPTVDMIEHQKKPLVFVVNAATTRARITGETAVALSQHGTVAPVTLHHRVDFAASMIDGRTVGEISEKSRSAKEVSGLWEYLADRLLRLRGPEALLQSPRPTFEEDVLTPARRETDFEEPVQAPAAEVVAPADPVVTPPLQYERRAGSAPSAPRPLEPPEPIAGDAVLPPAASQSKSDEPWDGIDRRKKDVGPPTGVQERRRSVFGRRQYTADPIPASQSR